MKKTYYNILIRRNGEASYLRTERVDGMISIETDWRREILYLSKRKPTPVILRTSLMNLGVWDVKKQNQVINDLLA